MSTLNFKIKVDSADVQAQLTRLASATRNRKEFNQAMAAEAGEETAKHLDDIAPRRHKTADRLGAKRTGFLSKAAKRIQSGGDDSEGYILIPRDTGLSRAFRDLVITPSRSKYLTIPAHKDSYGKKAAEVDGLRFALFGTRHRALVWKSGHKNAGLVAYWLKKSVTVPQDRKLLPPDRVWAAAAVRGGVKFIKKEQSEKS